MSSAEAAVIPGPFVDGEFTSSREDRRIEVKNPSTGRPCCSIPAGSPADVEAAVSASRRAVDDRRWSEAAPSLRKSVLHHLADLVAEHARILDELDAEEMGKPIGERLFSAGAASDRLRFCAEAVDKIPGQVLASDRDSLVLQRRIPRGVVAAVTPWNFPTFNAIIKIAPALAAGNSIVLKPSELASRSAVRLAQLALEAGLPPGVLNVVPGVGEIVGSALGRHMDVDMLTFTGSTGVGKLMLQYAGQSNLKVVMAECGGKSPQIVFNDGIDLDAVSASIAGFLLVNQGQICSVGSRLLVQRDIELPLVERIIGHFSSARMGDALDPDTTFGPIASEAQCERVMGYIETAHSDGAELVVGGRRALPQSGGYFVEPTLFRNVSPSARIAQEEIFGPVLSVIPFDDEAEAVRLANGTAYGLSAYVWTANLARGLRMAKSIRSSVRINTASPKGEGPGHAYSSEPYGMSGVGAEGGLPGIESYLRRHLIWFNHD